jgi:hypothetical protein
MPIEALPAILRWIEHTQNLRNPHDLVKESGLFGLRNTCGQLIVVAI